MKKQKSIFKKTIYAAITIISIEQTAFSSWAIITVEDPIYIVDHNRYVVREVNMQACILYEHNNSGYSVSLKEGQVINNLSGYMMERRTWHGHIWRWRGRDRSFNNAASSAKVSRGCVLEVADDEYFGGWRRSFDNPHGSWVSSQLYNLHNYNFGDRITSAKCTCTSDNTTLANDPYKRPSIDKNPNLFPVFPASANN